MRLEGRFPRLDPEFPARLYRIKPQIVGLTEIVEPGAQQRGDILGFTGCKPEKAELLNANRALLKDPKIAVISESLESLK
jgi:hypothetical protein